MRPKKLVTSMSDFNTEQNAGVVKTDTALKEKWRIPSVVCIAKLIYIINVVIHGEIAFMKLVITNSKNSRPWIALMW